MYNFGEGDLTKIRESMTCVPPITKYINIDVNMDGELICDLIIYGHIIKMLALRNCLAFTVS